MSLADLEGIFAQTDPAVLLVPPRILRRVIKQDRGFGGLGMQVPHYKSYVIRRDALLCIADRAELGVPPDRDVSETVILLPQPDAARLRSLSPETILRRCWRFLFHARVHLALEARPLDQAAISDRVRRLGSAVFNEARAVLRQDNFLLPHARRSFPRKGRRESAPRARFTRSSRLCIWSCVSSRAICCRAISRRSSTLMRLSAFSPRMWTPKRCSPHSTREGAALPEVPAADNDTPAPPPAYEAPVIPAADNDQRPDADSAAARGNDVRAARILCRASDRPAAQAAIRRLCERLQKALQFPAAETAQWRASLETLLEPAAGSLWPVEARLLYDLQRVCVDQEKEIYALDLVEWAVTWGRRPVKRLLPHQPFVLTVKYLRRALRRLRAARMPDDARHRLHGLLTNAVHHAEKRLRERFRPLIVGALDDVALRPANFPERVARDTVVEEMLDRIVERGFLTMGDVRDAIARNRLKLPDLANPAEVILGDQLLKANRRLAVAIDGVYRRGEIYMRWLQRLSSVFFGNAIGRFLVLFLILPLGGACVVVKGPHLVSGELHDVTRRLSRLTGGENPAHKPALPEGETPAEPVSLGVHDSAGASPSPSGTVSEHPSPMHHGAGHHSGLQFDQSDVVPLILASLFFLGLLHSARFRRAVWMVVFVISRGLRLILYDLPAACLRLPLVRRVLLSRAYLALYWFVFKPLFWSAPLALVLYAAGVEAGSAVAAGGLAFVAVLVLVNSRLGLRAEEACTDALVRGWYLLRDDLVPGLFRRIMGFFKWLLEGLDRIIYTFDEWLRFRTGDSRFSMVVKPVLGLTWFAMTYVVRIAINLFIEPTLNPIKHFPVVTVSAKLLLPLIPTVNAAVFGLMSPLVGRSIGHVLAVLAILMLPGIAGFLVWELKENWKLYRANQADELKPVTVGGHGETMLRLMRPGFHSGTLPKLYAKLRHYERSRYAPRLRKRREDLHHVEEAVRHFAERNLLAVLAGSHGWSQPLFVGAVQAATNRIRIKIACTDHNILTGPGHQPGENGAVPAPAFEIVFEEQTGRLVGGVAQSGWLEHLGDEERRTVADALAGFYKLAGVDLVREQVATVLPQDAAWSMDGDWLVVWQSGRIVDYRLNDASALPWDRVLFSRAPLKWADWVEAWQRDQDGKGHEPPLLPDVRFLPGSAGLPLQVGGGFDSLSTSVPSEGGRR